MSIIEKVKTIIEIYGQNDQRTDGWHTKRGQMLTASKFTKRYQMQHLLNDMN